MTDIKKDKLDELTHFIQSHPIVYETYKKYYETDEVKVDYFQSYSIEDIDLFISTWSRFMK